MSAARRRPPRGISLVEALVAMAIMAFGMLAVAGTQGMLRMNADIARQRSEAVRIAQEEIETWRRFSVRTVEAGAPAGAEAWDDIASAPAFAPAGYTDTNTTYAVVRTVTTTAPGVKSLRVTVGWTDRTGAAQTIELNSSIALQEPALAATLGLRPAGSGAGGSLLPGERAPGIPLVAQDLGNGRSAWRPDADGATVWLFNNVSGYITGICSLPVGTTLSAAALASCTSSTLAQFISGEVRFADTGLVSPFTTALRVEAAEPSGDALPVTLVFVNLVDESGNADVTPSCFIDSPPGNTLRYACALVHGTPPTPPALPRWSGRLDLAPAGSTWEIGTASGQFSVCRYTTLRGDSGANAAHPLQYASVGEPALLRQNFLVIPSSLPGQPLFPVFPANGTAATQPCPDDIPPDLRASLPETSGNFQDDHTRLHQP